MLPPTSRAKHTPEEMSQSDIPSRNQDKETVGSSNIPSTKKIVDVTYRYRKCKGPPGFIFVHFESGNIMVVPYNKIAGCKNSTLEMQIEKLENYFTLRLFGIYTATVTWTEQMQGPEVEFTLN